MGGHPTVSFPPGSGGRITAANYDSSNSTNKNNHHFGSGGAHHHRHHIHNYHDDAPTRTVYKKAPGAPKRFKSSYVHFFTHFIEKKKHELGPDGEVSHYFCAMH